MKQMHFVLGSLSLSLALLANASEASDHRRVEFLHARQLRSDL